jgi:antitoxin MazE
MRKRKSVLTKIKKGGNSLALRISKTFADDGQIENDSVVDGSYVDGQIVVKPIAATKWSLDELLAGVNEDNIHHETDAGLAVGKEVW